MRKILLLCSVAFMFACSNDSEETTQSNSQIENATTASRPIIPIENATDQMFSDYVNSDIFKEVRQLNSDFYNDLNIGDSTISFTPTNLFSWIETNLSTTNFTSVQQARTRWNHIISRKNIEVAQFQNVYDFIINAPIGEAVYYLDKWLPDGVGNVSTSNCQTDYKSCKDKANAAYKKNLADAKNDQSGTPTNELYDCADLQHADDIKACTKTYDDCRR